MLKEVKKALKKDRYSIRSFCLTHGINSNYGDRILRRASEGKCPQGLKAKQFISALRDKTGIDISKKG